MKIAVPVTSDNKLDNHFGHCEFFKIYSIKEDGSIDCVKKITPGNGCGCKSGIAPVLAAEGVTVMLAGGIGSGAVSVLNSAGIKVIRGCSGNPDNIIKLFTEGKINDSGETCLQHEHHHNHGSQGGCHKN